MWKRFKKFLIKLLQDDENVDAIPSETKPSEETLISKQPGLVCPQCSHKIQVSIDMLLSGAPIECPSCQLKLNVNKEESPVLDRLKKLDEKIKDSQLKSQAHG